MKSVFRIGGSVAGRPALKAATNTDPETVFVPRLPVRTTRIRRPDTPRSDRSIPLSVPTFVRESLARIDDRAARV